MKKFLALGALAAAVCASLFVGRAGAILSGTGTPDGNDHKGVGYVVFYDRAGVPLWRCTGSLVSTRVLLTAGHCAGTFDNSTGTHTPALAQVWFDKQVKPGGAYPSNGPAQVPPVSCLGFKGYPCSGGDSIGIPVPHPDYVGSADGTSHDLGVVVLAKAQSRQDVLGLAPVDTLVKTKPGTPMTIVGYGIQSENPPSGDRQRMRGTINFLRWEDGLGDGDEFWFADFTNAAPGAVACLGDSGGPVIDPAGDIVSVIALAGDDTSCVGDGFHYRTDTNEARDFLATFHVTVPGSSSYHPRGGHDGRSGHDTSFGF